MAAVTAGSGEENNYSNGEEEKRKMQDSLKNIFAELLVEGFTTAEAGGEALKRLKLQKLAPKYFLGAKREAVETIDKSAEAGRAPGPALVGDSSAVETLFGDFYCLCMALKSRPAANATAEDPNLCLEQLERMFAAESEEVREASLSAMGRLLDDVLEHGCDELSASPAKLRVVLLMLTHPGLADGVDPTSLAFEVFRKLLQLLDRVCKKIAARDTLVEWFICLPLAHTERSIALVQQFITLSLLCAQGDLGSAPTLEAIMQLAKLDGLSRHIRNALRLLDIYCRSNQRRIEQNHHWKTRRKAQLARQRGELPEGDEGKSISALQFHNDAINECEGLIKHDLRELFSKGGPRSVFEAEEGADDRRLDFGVIQFPFVLTAVAKVRVLNIESLLMQREEVRRDLQLQMILRGGMPMNPWLVLKVRRQNVVEDALQQLGKHGSSQLKKPLKIMFDGEEGVDEGGVQKEFFQLLIEQLYNEDFGMFEKVDETRSFWFNKNSFEANVQFELFGTVLGLAIYNQVILDVKFPMALYKKVMASKSDKNFSLGLSDLLDFQPSLAQGLIALLEHEPAENFEEVFGPLRFVVEYECFGSMVEAELKPGGQDIPVTAENREEYVQMYSEFILNTSVQQQYGAFCRGFDQCMGDTLFRQLFNAEELELVICGSPDLDFHALEQISQYQDGYGKNSTVVRWFWEVIHSLSEEEKRNFLAFCTGCDRCPVGGLGRLTFVVSRAGPDSDALPTVHTCFNHFLLPEYATKEKTEARIKLAIQHCQGFGLM